MRRRNFSFSQVPTIRAKRSQFDLSQGIKTSGNVGSLYPFYCQEVYPGDTFKVKSTTVVRISSAFVKPVMDNLFLDTYFFFVPSRLVFDRWAEVFGENRESAWAQSQDVVVPGFRTSGTVNGAYTNIPSSNSVAGYLMLPVGQAIDPTVVPEISVLPMRCFAKIYDEWFRDENNIDPMNIIKGGSGQGEYLNNNPWSPSNYFGQCPKVAKFHDYFTSCLPSPQKGDPVSFAIGEIPASVSPVAGVPAVVGSPTSASLAGANYGSGAPLRAIVQGEFPSYNPHTTPTLEGALQYSSSQNTQSDPPSGSLFTDEGFTGLVEGQFGISSPLYASDLFAFNRSQSLNSVTVNDMRLAFQTQRMLERDARGGSRYTEFIEAHFGVHSPDARLQRSEFLGGKRTPVNVYQVAQTSAQSAEGSPAVGALGAYAHTVGRSRWTKGFVEHGYVIGVMCLRYHHTYSQGIERFATRRRRLDFYDPVFANIGEQPVMKYQLYAGAPYTDVFGYNEAYADLRYRPSRVSGEMSPLAPSSLDVYHFADDYENAPTLSKDFIEETPLFVDRTIAVQNNVSDQFIFDILVDNKAIRELPVYSIPGLIDHN